MAGQTGGAPAEDGAGAGTAGDERTESAIAADRRLSDDQKAALIAVYRSTINRP